jgi:microcystin-dependent protein
MIEVPIGTVVAFAGEIVDTGKAVFVEQNWLLCNGAALSSNEMRFNSLFQHIKTAHGNASNDPNPATDFNLPDYRGMFLRGVAHTRTDRDPNSNDRTSPLPLEQNGGNAGNKVGSIQADQIRKHTHLTVQMIGDNNIDGVDSTTTHSGDHHNEPRETDAFGGSETRPVNAYVNYIIRAI